MEELTIRNGDEFIKLGQAIKAVGFVESGVEAKDVIQRGKKLVGGEVIEFNGSKLTIKR